MADGACRQFKRTRFRDEAGPAANFFVSKIMKYIVCTFVFKSQQISNVNMPWICFKKIF